MASEEPEVYVAGTGGRGLTLRQGPGGAPIGALPDGTPLRSLGEQERSGERAWQKVRDGEGREGWVAAEFLTTEAPPRATPSVVAAAAPPDA